MNSYVTSDNQSREEHAQYNTVQGVLNDEGDPIHIPYVSGSYSYVGPDGNTYKVEYYADGKQIYDISKLCFIYEMNNFI